MKLDSKKSTKHGKKKKPALINLRKERESYIIDGDSESNHDSDINPDFKFDFNEENFPPKNVRTDFQVKESTCFQELDTLIKNERENNPHLVGFQNSDLHVTVRTGSLPRGKNVCGTLTTFEETNLSRPLLKSLNELSITTPTPIQSKVIPIALSGRDICARAPTGSGKTAAYILPTLERLLFIQYYDNITRVLILVPTRELAIQINHVASQLAKYMTIAISVVTGGIPSDSRQNDAVRCPDILIATPGRLIDLVTTRKVDLRTVEVLILDEADRLLDDHFYEQIKVIMTCLSSHKQTMLLSATMTDQARELSNLIQKSPVNVVVNDESVGNLSQEYVRIRPGHEKDRPAVLACLLRNVFKRRVIVFVATKRTVRWLHVVLGLFGISVGELHGDLTQSQRCEMLSLFKRERFNVLLATDLAARGLDVDNIETVINYNMPSILKLYIHRIGRTARAAKSGRAVSLIGEGERRIFKEIRKSSSNIKLIGIPNDTLLSYSTTFNAVNTVIDGILQKTGDIKPPNSMKSKIKTVKKSKIKTHKL